MSFLDNPLTVLPDTVASRVAIIETLWESAAGVEDLWKGNGAFNAYIAHLYNEICRGACAGVPQTSAFTHRQLLDMCQSLQTAGSTQSSALASLGRPNPDTERLVRLAAAILLPLNISGIGAKRPGKLIQWDESHSLKQLFDCSILPAIAPEPYTPTTPFPVQLPTKFNARNLQHIAGFDIVWTSVLTDHLKVIEVDDTIKLHIFHQTWLLERHLDLTPSIISKELILETFDSLALLIPKRDKTVKKWFNKLRTKYGLDQGAITRDHLALELRSLDHFKHWRRRLKIVKELYDGQEPNSPIRVWRDRRRPVQWWTFWIAVLVLALTIVFGLIQSITGILQLLRT